MFMQELAGRLGGEFVVVAEDLDREFERRLAETSSLAYRVAFSVLRHRQDAEDVAQDAYARAFRRFRSLRNPAKFRSWLVRMTWRLAIDHRRSQKRRTLREHADVQPATPGAGLDPAIAQERAAALWQAIDALPPKLRLVVVLAAIEEQDHARVASVLGVPVGTVKSRLFLARQQLRERLQCHATSKR